jgi:hypothetical protein
MSMDLVNDSVRLLDIAIPPYPKNSKPSRMYENNLELSIHACIPSVVCRARVVNPPEVQMHSCPKRPNEKK